MVSRLTMPGRIETRRRRYDQPGLGSVNPLDAAIDLAGQAISLGVVQLSCRLALDAASFSRAGECLLAASGLRISDETLRELVEHEGKQVVAAQEAEQLELDWCAGDCRTLGANGEVTTRLYMGCDGVMVPLVTAAEKRKRRSKAIQRRRQLRRPGVRRQRLPAMRQGADDRFKEMKLVNFYDQDRTHRLVRATRKNHQHAGQLMRQGLVSLRARGAQERVALIDGAVWINRQAQQRRPPFTSITLDFWHLAEHVHATRRETFGEETSEGHAWAQQVLKTLQEQGYEPFWQQLVDLRARRRGRRARKSIDGLMHYVAARRPMLDYLRHREHGWDLGSGPTESMCKVMTRRVKGGKRWDADNAEAMMALEGLLQSHQWSAWWQYRLKPAA